MIRRVVMLSEEGSAFAEALTARFEAAGVEVFGTPRLRQGGHVLEQFAESYDAGIEVCVAYPEIKVRNVMFLDRILSPAVPILTCCHATSATAMAAEAGRFPERVMGFGLLPPFEGRATVECARAARSSELAVAAAEKVWKAVGLEPVWVGDTTGLVLPRIVACLVNEAMFALMERAAAAEDIDRAMMLGTRYPRGPLAWGEAIGWADVLAMLDGLAAEHGEDRYRAAPLLRRQGLAAPRPEVTW